MGTDDKIDAKADQLKGKVKEGVGDATGDQGLQTEGQVDQSKGHLKEAAEKVKDVFKKD
ncbi:CsbD family protein [Lentzea sp. NPDC092896]|uniref:CsbD family protein n=1 Tax=Lentzea sp. NPDC092896 TaxID=3364127 RepID=UPI003809CFF2